MALQFKNARQPSSQSVPAAAVGSAKHRSATQARGRCAEAEPKPAPPLAGDAIDHAVAASGVMAALLKPKEVADLLAVSERTLERWRITGEGPRFVRLGAKVVRYTREEAEAFVSARVKANTGQ